MITYLRTGCAIASVLIFAACAATTPGARPSVAAAAVTQNRDCLNQTGSRIATKNPDCTAVGRSYSSDDIDRTGAATVDEALRLMDPSIMVHR
jgi:hypothetical protein